MTSLFERQLMALQNEIEDLKTSHVIGAGSTMFYSAELTLTGSSSYELRAKIYDGEPMPPMIIAVYRYDVPGALPVGGQWIWTNNPSNNTYQLSLGASQDATVLVQVISSSLIERAWVE